MGLLDEIRKRNAAYEELLTRDKAQAIDSAREQGAQEAIGGLAEQARLQALQKAQAEAAAKIRAEQEAEIRKRLLEKYGPPSDSNYRPRNPRHAPK